MTADFQRTVLPNGLRVISERVDGVRSAAVGLWIDTGSRDEQPEVAGAAHYLEHLLFKATGRRTAAQVAEEIDAVGGELNAFTAKEHTCFYAHVLDADLPLAVDLITDVVFDAQCADADVETERSVVLDEIAMRDDDPEDLLHDEFSAAAMGTHALGRPILGSHESITTLQPDALRAFYRGQYRPPKMVLAVAGNVQHDDVLRHVEKALAVVNAPQAPADPQKPRGGTALITPSPKIAVAEAETEQTHLMLGLPGAGVHDSRRFPLSVYNAALGGGMSSRLFQQVREDRGLAYQVYSSLDSYSDAGLLTIYAGCQPDRAGEVTEVIRDVLADVVAGGLTDAEISRAKGQIRGGFVLGLEDTASQMSRIGRNELDYARYFSVDEVLAQIDAVTAEQIAEVATQTVAAAAVVGPYSDHDDLPMQLREVM